MRVIEHGNQARDWWHEATCKHCGCVMHVEESDVHWHHEYHEATSHLMHDTTISEARCRCPECWHDVTVCQFDPLPKPLRERLTKKRQTWEQVCRAHLGVE